MIFTYGDAIEAISPVSKGNEYYYVCKKVNGVPQYETYENIVWPDTNTDSKPSKSAVDAKFKELVADYAAKAYARNRKIEYDQLNQFELMTDDNANSTTTHADAIAAVKAKWPKDNSGPVE